MSMEKNLRKYIDELIQEVEQELDETTTTAGVDGYQTPFAFGGGRDKDKKKQKKNIDVTGYTKVKDIDESINEKADYKYLTQVILDAKPKYDVYYNSSHNVVNIGGVGYDKGDLVKNFNQKPGSSSKIKNNFYHAHQDPQKTKREVEKLSKGKIKVKVGDRGFLSYSVNESVNEAKDMAFVDYLKVLDDKFLDGMKAVRGDNGSDAQIKPTRGDILQNFTLFRNYLSALTKKYKGDKTKLRFLTERSNRFNELVNEAKVKRPVNRWLELKNDDTMTANKKMAMGLKELKYQLAETEKFFNWYNKIKNINELDSDKYWKRTNKHIYKIKERLVNIAKTIKEIEK